MKTRKNFARVTQGMALALAVALSLSACDASSGGEADAGKVRVAMVCGGMTPMAGQLAINAGTFPDEITVEKVCFDGGSDAMQALIGGSVEVFMGSTEHVLSTRAQGLNTRAYAGINNHAPYALLTSADSDIQSAADLEGETVGVTSPGSLSDTELKIAVEENDVDYESLKVIGAGSGATMASSVQQGQIAAGMVSDPQRSELLESGNYRVIWEPEFDYASIIAIADEGWVSENKDTMRSFLSGIAEAAGQAEDDTTWAVDAMKKEEFPVSDTALTSAVKRGVRLIPDGLVVSEAVYDSTVENVVAVDALPEEDVLPYEEVYDFEYLEAAP